MKQGRPYNFKRRAKILEFASKGLTIKEIAQLLEVKRQVVEYYLRTYPQS